jgi:putative ABC transport system permease protein
MKGALVKDTGREIRRSFSRFLSIFCIVMLGVSFFAGVKATCPDMKLTADRYFDDNRLMDIRVVSTLGLTDDDVAEIQKIPGIAGIDATYNMDTLVKVNSRDLVIRVISLPMEQILGDSRDTINRPKLIQGRWPQNENECVTERGKIVNTDMSIGAALSLSSGTDKDIGESLKNKQFTIVGIVETPYYISLERGNAAVGSGKINTFIMIPKTNFKLDYYTDIFLTVKGAIAYQCYEDAYDDAVEPVKIALEDIAPGREQARYKKIMDEANDKLNDGKQELADAEATQKEKLADAMDKINDAQKKIDDGEKELKENESKFNRAIKSAKAKLNKGYADLAAGEKEYKTQYAAFQIKKKEAQAAFAAAQAQIDAAQKEIGKQEAALNALQAALADPTLTEEQKAALQAKTAALAAAISAAKAKTQAAINALAAQKKQLSDAEKTLADTRKLLDSSKKTLDKNKKLLASKERAGRKKLNEAREKLADAKDDLAEGRQEYNDKKSESDRDIADAHGKLSDAQKDISEIKEPEWHVLTRDTNPGFVEYGQAADRMDAIALVFPVFFILVTALVCLTTMTRMIDEQRILIGTLKALGYSKLSIAAKYLIYASAASVTGSIAGLLIGFRLFPAVITNAYAIMYTLPQVITPFNVPLAVISMLFAVLVTTLTAWAACNKELKAPPAALMRIKAPKAGKRVLLERVRFIWSRLNFTRKITFRNIFRYKKRFLMTVLGIAGCTALLLAGFGLKDSISSIVSKQYGEVYQYNMLITLSDEGKDDPDIFMHVMTKENRITEAMLLYDKSYTLRNGKAEKEADLLVPGDVAKLPDFIVLRERTTGKSVAMRDDGVVLTEKLAAQLSAQPGSVITFEDDDGHSFEAKVTGITENYVSHYAYMTPGLYSALFGKAPVYNEAAAKTTNNAQIFEDALSTDLMKHDSISSIRFSTYLQRNFSNIIKSLYYVVLVLIISAGALAMVVLYNLTNINITERIREIATIKVLGFYDNEVSAYVYRENIILTMIGMLAGIVLGIFLHRYIVVTAEVDMVMFGREIAPLSYFYSAALTAAFTGIVNFFMYFRLRRINMVESLKSME